MTDLFDFKARPSNYGVMGNPVKHSRSPDIHTLFARQFDISMHYQRIQVDIGGFDQALSHFSAHGGAGLNITVPYKGEAWNRCCTGNNRLSGRAGLAESVNTLRFEEDGSIYGDNTDGQGLVTDLESNIGIDLENKDILIVGAGGAVRGVLGPILDQKPASLTIANRTLNKASALVARFADWYELKLQAIALDQTGNNTYELIINGTAAGLDGKLPGLVESCLNKRTIVYDMMYSQQPTVFMQWALSNGARQSHDGLGMLVEQAAESFYLWHGKRPQTRPVIEALKKCQVPVTLFK